MKYIVIILIAVCIFNITFGIYILYRIKREGYKYSEENPNALISGKSIGGTVYASYPEKTPGLGWIL